MIALWGMFNQRGQDVAGRDLSRPFDARLRLTSATLDTICQGNVGMAQVVVSDPGDYQPPDPAADPTVVPIVCVGRVDNREQLCRILDGRVRDPRELSDRVLIGLAYARWGADCVDHILGDWAFALWDERSRQCVLARDPCGRASVFYAHDPASGRLLFSTFLGGILAMPGVPRRLDSDYIAQHTPGIPRDDRTPYVGVKRLTPGHLLIATPNQISVRQYWRSDVVPAVRRPVAADYVEGLVEVFHEAVRCRLSDAGPVGAFLSGGLDSGAVAVLAAAELSAGTRRLHAFSSVPRFAVDRSIQTLRTGDETRHIQMVAAQAGNIDVSLLPSADVSIIEGIRTSLAHVEEPRMSPASAFWYLDVLQQARDRGIRTLLCGEGGNTTVSYHGDRAEHRAALWERSAWGSLALDTAGTLWQRWPGIGRLLHPGGAPGEPRTSSALNPEFLRSRSARLDRSEDSIGTHSFVSDQSRIVNKYLRSGAFTMTWNLASSMGLDIRDPTMDKRVVEYCLGIPRDQYRHVGRQRMLFRRAMAGRLPDQVLWNPRRGLQSADITSRIQAERRDINETLHRFEAAPITRHYLNLGRLRSTFERLSQVTGPRAYGEAVNVLLRGVMIGLFLLASEEG